MKTQAQRVRARQGLAVLTACLSVWGAPCAAAADPGGESLDPYLWLEKQDSPEVMQWVHGQDEKTLAVLEQDPHFAAFDRAAIEIAEAHDRIAQPQYLHGRIYNLWQDDGHVRGIWRYTDPASYATGSPAWTTALDLDALAKSENANWVWQSVDCEQSAERRCLVGLSDGGEDADTEREFDLDKSAFVPGGFTLPRGKQGADWEDPDTLLVAREWHPGELTASGYPYIVKRLRRGQSLDQATEVFRGSADDVGVRAVVESDAEGRRAVLILRERTTFEQEFYLVTRGRPARLALPKKADVEALAKNQLIVSLAEDWSAGGRTFKQGALVAVDLDAARRHPEALSAKILYEPAARESFVAAGVTRDGLLVATLENVQGRMSLYRLGADGAWSRGPIDLPENSSLTLVDTDRHGHSAFVGVTGFLQPSSLWRVDTTTASFAKIKELPPQFDASTLAVQQLEATSSDGTKIPYFLVAPKLTRLDGRNPTIIYAYGGFQISVTPRYQATIGKLWLERGGSFVVANIRGGGEFGPAWHEAGLKTHRQIIYDDFAAVARDLISRKITSPQRLGIQGGSNGGLLMGVEFTQHPELWNAVDIQVPLLDMLRFESIDAGTSWVGEYGSVSNPQERAFLASISPYANLKRGVQYPRPFVWTTTKDDRVGPQHARKFAARLAEYGIPYLFYEEVEGGHSAGANLREKARMSALEMTYFTMQLQDP
jgi:prolyl oligopeptidase